MQCLDEILLPIDDLELSFLVPLANVTGLEPAIFGKGFFRFFWQFEIAVGDRVAADPDLALWRIVRRVVACIREIDQLDLDRGWNLTEGISGPAQRVGEGAHSAWQLSVDV